MTVETTKWDSAGHLKTYGDVTAYLEAVFKDGNTALIIHALSVNARAISMTETTKSDGVTGTNFDKALSDAAIRSANVKRGRCRDCVEKLDVWAEMALRVKQ